MDTVNIEETKYTRVEYERRFLVSSHADWKITVEPYSKTFEDKYLRHTRLRLRTLTDSDTGRRLIKLTKKFESASPYFQTISRILLSPSEYELLDSLEGDRIKKIRHYHNYRNCISRLTFSRASWTVLFCVKPKQQDLMN